MKNISDDVFLFIFKRTVTMLSMTFYLINITEVSQIFW